MFAKLESEHTKTTQLSNVSSEGTYLQGASGDSFSIFTALLSSTTSLTFGLPKDCEAILTLTMMSGLVCLATHHKLPINALKSVFSDSLRGALMFLRLALSTT